MQQKIGCTGGIKLKYLGAYFEFIKMYLKARMEYKVSFFFELFSNFLMVVSLYIGIWILMKNFNSFNGWGYYEVLFLYSINIFCVALSGTFLFGPMNSLFYQVKDGSFDSILLRPLNPLKHLIFRNFQYSYLPWFVPVPFALYKCFTNMNMHFTLYSVLVLILSILGGVFVNSGLLIIAGSLSFWYVDSSMLISLLCTHGNSVRSFCDYPISVYSKGIQFILTFIIPYGFINYYPAVNFFNKHDGTAIIMNPFPCSALVAGIVVLTVSLVFWNISLKKYQSTGT